MQVAETEGVHLGRIEILVKRTESTGAEIEDQSECAALVRSLDQVRSRR